MHQLQCAVHDPRLASCMHVTVRVTSSHNAYRMRTQRTHATRTVHARARYTSRYAQAQAQAASARVSSRLSHAFALGICSVPRCLHSSTTAHFQPIPTVIIKPWRPMCPRDTLSNSRLTSVPVSYFRIHSVLSYRTIQHSVATSRNIVISKKVSRDRGCDISYLYI